MASRLYLHLESFPLAGGTYPSGEQDAATPDFSFTGAATLRELDVNKGPTQQSLSGNSTGTGTQKLFFLGMWATTPLDVNQTVGGAAETLTVNIADAENDLGANFFVNKAGAYVWRPSTGAKIGTLCSSADTVSGSPTAPTAINSEQVTTFSVPTPTPISALAGDIIVVELWAYVTQTNALACTQIIYFDGTVETTVENTVVSDHAAFIEFSQNLTFSKPGVRVTQQLIQALPVLSSATQVRSTLQMLDVAEILAVPSRLRVTQQMLMVLVGTEGHFSINAQETQGDTASIQLQVQSNVLGINAQETQSDTANIQLHIEPIEPVIEECPIQPYLDLVTMEHQDKLNFISMVAASVRPFVDVLCKLKKFPSYYDVDQAIGNQLDVVGKWVGVDRFLSQPLTGVFFSFDIPGQGFDQAVWLGPYDAATGLVRLPDEFYRLIIKVRILNNQWDGTKKQAYDTIQAIFAPFGYFLFIEDYGDLSITIGLVGSGFPTSLVSGLLTQGKFDVKPAGIRIKSYVYQSTTGPIFSFDMSTPLFAGFDVGAWGLLVSV